VAVTVSPTTTLFTANALSAGAAALAEVLAGAGAVPLAGGGIAVEAGGGAVIGVGAVEAGAGAGVIGDDIDVALLAGAGVWEPLSCLPQALSESMPVAARLHRSRERADVFMGNLPSSGSEGRHHPWPAPHAGMPRRKPRLVPPV
jgi:hypothetical protein